MEVFLGAVGTLAVIGYLALMIWFVVIAVRFLRSGRKAFDRYVALTQDQATSSSGTSRQPASRS